jgi:hypothetical protein
VTNFILKCSKCCHQDRQLQGNLHRGSTELALRPGIVHLCRGAGKWRGERGLRKHMELLNPSAPGLSGTTRRARSKVADLLRKRDGMRSERAAIMDFRNKFCLFVGRRTTAGW